MLCINPAIRKAAIVFLFSVLGSHYASAQAKILFDASKAESAGNADWVIDADALNLRFSPNASIGGTNSNAQRTPTPAQSSITAATAETYWSGGISAWGIDCVKKGLKVESLPYNGSITYGSTSNAQDLKNYKVFIVCEPNLPFTATEKAAIINFVKNGGSLLMVADHDQSDRNGDGWDSPGIWNDLMTNNSVRADPFGFSFDLADFSQSSYNISAASTDSLIHGPMGHVSQVKWAGGTTMTLHPANNSTIKGVIYKSGATAGNNNAMVAYGRYGQGKFAVIGDSSPCDDGTGDPTDNLFYGYTGDASGNHRTLLMNMTLWLAAENAPTGIGSVHTATDIATVYPNPSSSVFYVRAHRSLHHVTVIVTDISGRILTEQNIPALDNELAIAHTLPDGLYLLTIKSDEGTQAGRIAISR